MTIADALLAELDLEAPGTRKTIERVPDAKIGWQLRLRRPSGRRN